MRSGGRRRGILADDAPAARRRRLGPYERQQHRRVVRQFHAAPLRSLLVVQQLELEIVPQTLKSPVARIAELGGAQQRPRLVYLIAEPQAVGDLRQNLRMV